MIVSPKQAMDSLTESLEEPRALSTVLNLLDTGISAETIASALVLKMFSEGVFSPDVAEIIKPPLAAHITDLGLEAGIEDINVVNEVSRDGMTSDDSLNIMKQVHPDKFNRQMADFEQQEENMEIASQVELSPEEQEPERESFLDMEVQ